MQHTRFPCLSPPPRVCSNSCALSQWCHLTTSASVTLFSSPQSGWWVSSSHQVAKILELQLQHQSFQWIIFRVDLGKTSISALLTTPKPLTVYYNKLWKILQEMEIPEHLTCLLRNLYTGQEATVRSGHGTTDQLQIGKGERQGYILSSCLFNLYAEYIMRNAGLDEAQDGIKIAGRNINNLRYADDSTLMQITPPLWQKAKKN